MSSAQISLVSSSNPCIINQLPDVILNRIFDSCFKCTHINLGAVCKKWRSISHNLFKKNIEYFSPFVSSIPMLLSLKRAPIVQCNVDFPYATVPLNICKSQLDEGTLSIEVFTNKTPASFFKFILANNNLSNLRSLDLKNLELGKDALTLLKGRSNLIDLNLNKNYLKELGEQDFNQISLVNLRSLHLAHNFLRDQDLINLRGVLTQLTSVDLSLNHLSHEGAHALKGLTQLESLGLNMNKLGNEGAKIVASAGLINLTDLNMVNNAIEDQGAIALLQGDLTNLTSLDLRFNKITAQDLRPPTTITHFQV